jgi:hypothetical protein
MDQKRWEQGFEDAAAGMRSSLRRAFRMDQKRREQGLEDAGGGN